MRTPRRDRYDEEGRKVWRIQSSRPNFEGSGYRLQIPANIARLVGPDAEFTIELTDEGILFRKVGGEVRATELPSWLR